MNTFFEILLTACIVGFVFWGIRGWMIGACNTGGESYFVDGSDKSYDDDHSPSQSSSGDDGSD